MSHLSPRALVVLRVPRGAAPPAESAIRAEIEGDRRRLALPPDDIAEYRVAGPYAIELNGEAFDEYVAWEI